MDGLKSVILTLATAARVINIPEAVSLSRLEEEYQVYITFSIGFMIKIVIVRVHFVFRYLLQYVSDIFLVYIFLCHYYVLLYIDFPLGQRRMASRIQQTRSAGSFIGGDVICIFELSFRHFSTQN